MKTPVKNEKELISRIETRLTSRVGGMLRLGIGDDAAILKMRPGWELVLTCDFLLEERHFLLNVGGSSSLDLADAIGWKSLARATSDIAAMGGVPKCFLLSLALPRKLTGRWLDAFLGGMARAARRFGVVVAGGDTTVSEKVIVNVTVAGEVKTGRAITRAGARPGDLICVSGRLGEAQLGLEAMLRWGRQGQQRRGGLRGVMRRAIQKHRYPAPRLALGQFLAEERLVTAMIDTSDGLSTDLGHICEASGVGAWIFAEKIPAVAIPEALRRRGADALELALQGGEDYELLFTVPRKAAKRLPSNHGGVPLTVIGEIAREKKLSLIDRSGSVQTLIIRGWDPFRNN
jgi:thiamine-monophosphate kinase